MADYMGIYKYILADFLIFIDDKIYKEEERNARLDYLLSMDLKDLQNIVKNHINKNKSYSCFAIGSVINNFMQNACNDEINGIPLNEIYELFGIKDKSEETNYMEFATDEAGREVRWNIVTMNEFFDIMQKYENEFGKLYQSSYSSSFHNFRKIEYLNLNIHENYIKLRCFESPIPLFIQEVNMDNDDRVYYILQHIHRKYKEGA